MRMRSGVFMLRMVLPRKESGKYCPLVNHLGANAIGSAVPSLFCFPQLVARVLSLRTSRNAWSQVLDINWGQSIAAGLQHVLVFSTLAANAVSAVWSCFILPAIAELRPSPHKMQFCGQCKATRAAKQILRMKKNVSKLHGPLQASVNKSAMRTNQLGIMALFS